MIKKLFFVSSLALMANLNAQSHVVFQENFDDESTRSLWTIDELDGDGDTWEYVNAEDAMAPSFSGDFAWSWSWLFPVDLPDNLLISPAINLPDSNSLELSFKISAADDEEGLFEEHYAVYVIPANSTFTGTETPVFEETLEAGYYEEAKVVKVDVSSYAGQEVKLVFRHYDCVDIFYLGMDDVMITDNTLAVSDVEKKKVQIYPNPTSDFIKINGGADVQKVRIFDMQGKKVLETTKETIDVRQLPKGQYIINVYSDSEVQSNKFIKK